MPPHDRPRRHKSWSWGRRRKEPHTEPKEVPCPRSDYECFLAGDYVRFLEQHDRPVPGWAWLNVLAHGTDEQITELASRPLKPQPGVEPPGSLGDAVAYLAGVILAAARTRAHTLAYLQRSALIPLELTLASDPERQSLTPADLVAAVTQALYPRSR
jgi:hypothetical protein